MSRRSTTGAARVHTQWGDAEDDILEAVQMCPVDCISFVKREQLALLEFVLKSCAREDTALMARRWAPMRYRRRCSAICYMYRMQCSTFRSALVQEVVMHCSSITPQISYLCRIQR